MGFELHPRLREDTTLLGEFPLSIALLHRDNSVPWIILVPKRELVREIFHLSPQEQQQLLSESHAVCQALEATVQPDKLNYGTLGNVVSQLHVHHVARYETDIAWPGPIWGNAAGVFREDEEQQVLHNRLKNVLKLSKIFKPN